MPRGTQNLACSSESDAPKGHPGSVLGQVSKQGFESLLILLGASRHTDVVELFDGRVPYHTIVDWRRGHVAVPRWAWAHLTTLLRRRASELLSGAAIGEDPPAIAPGQGSHNNIAKWNARRFAEKKKPGV